MCGNPYFGICRRHKDGAQLSLSDNVSHRFTDSLSSSVRLCLCLGIDVGLGHGLGGGQGVVDSHGVVNDFGGHPDARSGHHFDRRNNLGNVHSIRHCLGDGVVLGLDLGNRSGHSLSVSLESPWFSQSSRNCANETYLHLRVSLHLCLRHRNGLRVVLVAVSITIVVSIPAVAVAGKKRDRVNYQNLRLEKSIYLLFSMLMIVVA